MNTIAWITSKNEQYDIKDIEARKTKLNIEDLPKNLSAFSNDVGFIDNTVNDLINYYKKSETYTKTEIDQKLSAKWDSKFVDKLPTEDISTTTIYFLKRKKEQGTTQYESDVYDEYIYTGTWELIGNTYVDLTDYYRKSEVEEVIDNKVLVETNNRILSENELKNNIENVNNYAKSIENNLNSEISTRQNNDLLHDTKINEVENNLNSEISRATNAENILSSRCDTYDSHIANIDNPHSVTAEQIGLGNVTNVSTTDTITLNSENNITSGAVYTALENKVDKIDGRGLSEQNFTYAEKTKLSELKNYDDTSISNRVTATENAITTLNGNSSVSGSVDKKIADAIAGITQLDFKIVSELPGTGIKGTIYLIRGTGTETTQQYDEYIWVNSKWEQLGKSTIEVDLSDVYSKSEVNALVSVKNDKITITDDNSTAITDADTFSTTSNSGTNPTNLTKRPLSLLWNYIEGKISSVLGLTKDNYGGKANTATTAESANKIKPNYTKSLYLTEVSSGTIKYIKIADCTWRQAGTLQVGLSGSSINDILVINFGGGNATTPMLCGHYSGHARKVLSVIAQNGSEWNSNYSIYVKVKQSTTCNVQVALLKGSCTINITESTTAPKNISEWAVNYGLFGDLTGNVTGNVTGSSGSASKLTTARKAYVDLGTESTTSTIDWSGDTTIPVNGVLQVEHGGTGATTAEAAASSLIASLASSQDVPVDSDYFISQVVNGGPFVPGYERRPISKLWEYIKGKISSVLGLTATRYNGIAVTSNKIEPNYTTDVALTEVTSDTTKYIKIADCSVSQAGTLQVYLVGSSFLDILVINFVAGNSREPVLCGYYGGNNHLVSSVITQNGSEWNSNYSIYVKVKQSTTCNVRVALLKGSCTINITESTTAPTNISEWPVDYGLFGTLTGKATTATTADKATTATTADKVKNALTINGQSFDGSSAVNISIQEGAYDHIVHDGDSLLEWANCTDGSMKKVLIKSGTYDITKCVNLSQAGTSYVLAENGAVINSHVPIAFTASSGKTVAYNLSVVCDGAANGDNSCAFSADNPESLILYDCSATYRTYTEIVNRNLFVRCTCYNCSYAFQNLPANSSISMKVFYQCRCYNCKCKQTIESNSSTGIIFDSDSYFYKECYCASCDAELTTLRNIKSSTKTFACYYNCWDRCVGCLSKINVNSKDLAVYSTLYGFLRCQYMSSCKETHTEGYTNIKGITQCDFISSTSGINGGSNTHVGNSCSIQ